MRSLAGAFTVQSFDTSLGKASGPRTMSQDLLASCTCIFEVSETRTDLFVTSHFILDNPDSYILLQLIYKEYINTSRFQTTLRVFMKMFVSAIVCLVTGFSCLINSADGLDPITITAIATVAGGAIVGGPSFLSWGLSGNTLIETNITVENWTRFPMSNPELRLRSGVVSVAPRDIQPGTKEIFHARKISVRC